MTEIPKKEDIHMTVSFVIFTIEKYNGNVLMASDNALRK